MNVILLITIIATFDNGIVSRETLEIEGLPSIELCEHAAKAARKDADMRNIPGMEITTVCKVKGTL